jgi:chromosome segregation ATPase
VSNTNVSEDIRGLAETFASMVVQIEAREFHANQLIAELRETQRQLEAAQKRLRQENTDLRFRLRKLEVRYDETQANKEVSEIAESDYFRELQQRAKSMRTKFKPRAQDTGRGGDQ